MRERSLISVRQIKAARVLLAWSQRDLAKAAGVSLPTLARLEAVEGPLGGRPETVEKLQAALEARGVEFTNGDAPGVRLRRPPRTDPLPPGDPATYRLFEHRGLSGRTIQALVAGGIDAPERLLLMPREQIALVPNIGQRALAEIKAYRSRFGVD